MDTSQAIDQRASCHSYLNKSIGINLIEKVLDAGLKAPNSGNIQNLRFIIVRSEGKKEEIADACKQKWVNEAPVIIMVVSDLELASSYYKDNAELYSTQNAATATENMLLTATSLGLGNCWVSIFDNDKIRTALKLPDNFRPEAVMTLGYSKGREKKSKRFNLRSSVFFEEFGNKDSKQFFPLKESLNNMLKKFKKKS